jgi:hypothetical protein
MTATIWSAPPNCIHAVGKVKMNKGAEYSAVGSHGWENESMVPHRAAIRDHRAAIRDHRAAIRDRRNITREVVILKLEEKKGNRCEYALLPSTIARKRLVACGRVVHKIRVGGSATIIVRTPAPGVVVIII